MKQERLQYGLKLFITLFSFITFFSCKEKEVKQTEVEKYVLSLKSNQFENVELPAFTYKDIDELLKYRNERDTIQSFPAIRYLLYIKKTVHLAYIFYGQ